MLLDFCGSNGNKWGIKFYQNKKKSVFHLNGSKLKKEKQIKYLGFIMDSNLDLNTQESSFFGIL
ncbi:hypothetical protein BpHYR1_040795 [Brachionus plicatilis]|uniref:RNA-directed DNA polymerase from mobile element jockey-like n=1 Tax=Brachionus plicatilis TaxID=10195 RepID=A0A3M7RKL7_BRAPC|nr:hypothetical protein BpHYR1_040795 [Brachionus plicatilis]